MSINVFRNLGISTILAAAIATSVSPGSGQMIGPSTCAKCHLELVKITTIPSNSGSTLLISSPQIALSAGNYVLGPTYDGALAVWDNNSLRTLGHKGGGPNEFPKGDALYALRTNENGNVLVTHANRLTVLDAGARKIQSQAQFDAPNGLAPLGNTFATTRAARGGVDIVVASLGGKVLKTFPATVKPGALDVVLIAASGDSAVWLSTLAKYRFDLVRLDGTLIRSIERNPTWFKGAGHNPGEPLRSPPAPRIVGVREMKDGLLMLLFLVPDAHWKPTTLRNNDLRALRIEPLFDTVVEVVDLKTNQLVATARYDQFLRFVHGSQQVWTAKEDADGNVFFEVYDLQIRR